jgi:hypothetical protein
MPYNLPPNKCLKEGFIFLAPVIPGPKDPKKQMNIFLCPLMKELKELWQGVDAYDSYLKCQFNLCVVDLWSIHNYLAYGKFVGWCVHGRLNCPVCMDKSDAFKLQHSRKVSFFDCHQRFLPLSHEFRGDKESFQKCKSIRKGSPKRKLREHIVKMLGELKESQNGGFKGYGKKRNWTQKSCLCELPYAKALILPQNINLMHQEHNVAESIISMCFDVTGFSKDNINARKDLASLCNRPSLEPKINAKGNPKRPWTPYCPKPAERKKVLRWLKKLKFLDRYASNIKQVVNVSTGKLNGLKSHDYHIIIERLMPVMFHGYFDVDLWKIFAKLSYFYRQICAK